MSRVARYFEHVSLFSRPRGKIGIGRRGLLIPWEKSLLMPVLIFAARALASVATLLHNGAELAPAFPLGARPSGYIIVPLSPLPPTPPPVAVLSPIFVRDL